MSAGDLLAAVLEVWCWCCKVAAALEMIILLRLPLLLLLASDNRPNDGGNALLRLDDEIFRL